MNELLIIFMYLRNRKFKFWIWRIWRFVLDHNIYWNTSVQEYFCQKREFLLIIFFQNCEKDLKKNAPKHLRWPISVEKLIFVEIGSSKLYDLIQFGRGFQDISNEISLLPYKNKMFRKIFPIPIHRLCDEKRSISSIQYDFK